MIAASVKMLSLHYVEKRKSPRLPCHLPVDADCRKKYGFNHIVDISLNGVGILCDKLAAAGSVGKHVKLRFFLPGQGNFVERIARVAFAKDQAVGLHFLPSEKPEQERFKNFYLSVNASTALEEIFLAPPLPSPALDSAAAEIPPVSAAAAEPPLPSDKRASARKPLRNVFEITLTTKDSPRKVVGRVTDESRHGVSFEFSHPAGVPLPFRIGHQFSDGVIAGNGKTVRTGPAKVCHVTPVRGAKGLIKVGLAIGAAGKKASAKSPAKAASAPACSVVRADLAALKPEPSNGAGMKDQPGLYSPIHLKFKNAAGEEIDALLNTTFGNKTESKVPVVVMVPGFAQRKESATLLAQILIQTFLHHKKELAVLRFDFTRALGESFTDVAEEEREGSEYLTFTFSQAVADLKAALAAAGKNSHFSSSQLIVVSTGFATPIVLRALVDEDSRAVRHWLHFFGASDLQEWVKKSAHADFVADYAQGRRAGLISFPGSLLNIDRLVEDALRSRLAWFEDTRREMAQLSAPVTWLYGEHDPSVPAKKVRELMETAAPAPRKLIELPLGHLHYNHVKATPALYLVGEELFSALHGRRVKACVPDPDLLKKITDKEWSSLK